MAYSTHPLPGAIITSAKMADHLRYLLSLASRYHSGYDATPTGLTANIETGIAFINGYRVGLATDSDEAASLVAASTNHVFLQFLAGAGVLVVNQNGSVPANSIKLYEFDTNGVGVTATRDMRDPTIILQDEMQANAIVSLAGVYGTLLSLSGAQPYLELIDITGGGDSFRIWNRNGKIQITDTSGAIVYVTDATEIYEGWTAPVIDKDLNAPPGSPANYDRYIVGPAPTGAWATHAGKITEYTGAAWEFYTPLEGYVLYVKDEDLLYQYSGAAWSVVANGVEAPTPSTLVKRTATGTVRAADANPLNVDEVIPIGQADARYQTAGTVTESAQDAVGAMLLGTPTIDLTYSDVTPSLSADVKDNSIDGLKLRDSAALSVMGRAVNSAGDPTDLAAASDGQVLRRSGVTLGFGTVATAGLADDAVTFAKMQDIATDRLIGRDTAATGSPEEISVGGGVEFSGATAIRRSALTGDVTASAGSGVTAISADAVTNTKLANMAQATVKGRAVGAGTGDPTDLTAAQVIDILETADGAASGLDADLLDGFNTAQGAPTASTVPVRTAAGAIFTATPTDPAHAATKAYADASGIYAKRLSNFKVSEGLFYDGGNFSMSIGYAGGLASPQPAIRTGIMGEVGVGHLPTGTVVEIQVSILPIDTGGVSSLVVVSWGSVENLEYMEPSHAVNPYGITISTTRESDGGTDLDTLADWASAVSDNWEFIHTVQGNSAGLASARIVDLVVKRNGATVLTKNGRRIIGSSPLLNLAGRRNQSSMDLAQMPAFRITLP